MKLPLRLGWRIIAGLCIFAFFWTLVFLIQAWLAPRWLTDTRTGLGTVLGLIPTTIIALYALTFGTFWLVVQQATNLYGSRAALIVFTDPRGLLLIARSLVIVVAGLLLAARIPDGRPSDLLTAATSTLALSTCVFILRSGSLLAWGLGRYVTPRSFAQEAVRDIEGDLKKGLLDRVVYKLPMFVEMLRNGLNRGDGMAVNNALEAVRQIQSAYIATAETDSKVREYRVPSGAVRHAWLGEDLKFLLVRATEDALERAAPEQDVNDIVRTLAGLAVTFIQAGMIDEARFLVTGLTELGVTAHQVSNTGAINYLTEPAFSLATIERVAEEAGEIELAADALVSWSVATAYLHVHFNQPHPLFRQSVAALGSELPLKEAMERASSAEWRNLWANKVRDTNSVIGLITRAHQIKKSEEASSSAERRP